MKGKSKFQPKNGSKKANLNKESIPEKPATKKKMLADELFDLSNPAPKFKDIDPEDLSVTSSWRPKKSTESDDFDNFEPTPRLVGKSLRGVGLDDKRYAGKVVSRKNIDYSEDEMEEEEEEDNDDDEDDQPTDGMFFGSSSDEDDVEDEDDDDDNKGKSAKTAGQRKKAKAKVNALFQGMDYDSQEDNDNNNNDFGETSENEDEDDEANGEINEDPDAFAGFSDGDDNMDDFNFPEGEDDDNNDNDNDNDNEDDEEEEDSGLKKMQIKSNTLNEADDLERQLQEEEEELQKSMKTFKTTNVESELEKAQHTKNQKILYASFLDSRVRMQSCIQSANRFPQGEMFDGFVKQNKKVKSQFSQVSTSIQSLLGDLVDLQLELKADRETPVSSTKKRKFNDTSSIDEVWAFLQKEEELYQPYVEETLNKWSQRALLSSGQNIGKQFKAVNQTVMSQVNQILADKEKLRKRTQLKRMSYKIFGDKNDPTSQQQQKQLESHDQHLNDYDEEIFDDSDFYQLLLKEVIESGMQDMDPLAYHAYLAESNKLRKKTKKQVDRRASKGRKLRYQTHEKLVGFMAPLPLPINYAEQLARAQELFSNLFGQKQQLTL